MLARVARFEGGDADQIRAAAEDMKQRAASGPPEGVPSVGFTFLTDVENGRVLAIGLFENEEDLKTGDAALNDMSPPAGSIGNRASVEVYEVSFEARL